MSTHAGRGGPLALYRVFWSCATASGIRLIWAHTGDEAVEHLQKHASFYGLPHENVIVANARGLTLWDAGDEELDGFAA
jgi:hypothetical protein